MRKFMEYVVKLYDDAKGNKPNTNHRWSTHSYIWCKGKHYANGGKNNKSARGES